MKFLILSVTAGEGHNSTARAIRAEFERLGCEAAVLDTFDYISPELAKLLADGYLLATERAKGAYRIGYRIAEKRHSFEQSKLSSPAKLMNLAISDDLGDYINADRYDAILFTHPFAGVMLDVMKERRIIANRTLGILTDFTFHPFWEDCIRNDFVVVPDAMLLPQARRKGFRDEQILPFGIPISPAFAETVPKAEARSRLGLNEKLPTFLVMGGSMGYGNIRETVERLDACGVDRDFQMIVVCGNNQERKAEVDAYAEESRHRILATGFVDYVPLLMDASDCILTKPGGLTTSESLAKGLPMILVNPIPGQEERNAEFLLNAGCAMAASKTCPPDDCLYQLLSSDARREAMRQSIASVGKPHSTENVCRFLVDLALKEPVPADPATALAASDFSRNPIYLDEDGYFIRQS